MALILVWAHELGHIFLGHLDASNMAQHPFKSGNESSLSVATFNVSQLQELDADMFASDAYFVYLTKGIHGSDDASFRAMHTSGFEFFWHLAHIEQQGGYIDMPRATHPPSSLRLLNMWLRHERALASTDQAFAGMLSKLKPLLGTGNVPPYDYAKDIRVSSFLV